MRRLESRDHFLSDRKGLLIILLIGTGLLAAACTRSTAVVVLPSPPVRPSATAVLTPTVEPEIPELSGQLAVAWTERGDPVSLRGEAGIASEPQEELPYDARNIRDLSQTALLGSSAWMHVESPSGIQGWVPSWHLIEQIEPSDFCRDPRVIELIGSVREALSRQDGELLEVLVSERRGLILRYDPWNPEIRIGAESVPDLFDDPTEFAWGERYISETEIEGSFRQVFLPRALEVIGHPSTEWKCMEVPQGITQLQVGWPEEYVNVPHYGLYRPSPLGGNPFYWRTLAVGIEYVDGRPYLAVLLLVQPPI